MPTRENILPGTKLAQCVYLSDAPAGRNGRRRANFRCFCGNEFSTSISDIKSGKTQGCGCLNSIHGASNTTEYTIWENIKQRCYNPKAAKYRNYGGRGIKMCDRWRDSFVNFYSDMGKRPSGYSVDRIDHNGDYHPDNCRWASFKTQSRNMRTNDLITYNGETRCLTEWAELIGMAVRTLHNRLYRSRLSIGEAFTKPVTKKKPHLC